MSKVPFLNVGIQARKSIEFTLKGEYKNSCGLTISGRFIATRFAKSFINLLKDDGEEIIIRTGLELMPQSDDAVLTLHKVTIGIDFHWQREEDQVFKGGLRLLVEGEMVRVVNVVSIEDYLQSVISSEMSATSSLELLKAHAVISRSWLLAQIEKNKKLKRKSRTYQSLYQTEDELIKWYDREDHKNFDVCADDHCQRYQGISKASTPAVENAVMATQGQVLMSDNVICDARFSKCCGGKVEQFENVWEPVNHSYLQTFADNNTNPQGLDLNLRDEDNARTWILNSPDAFCNTNEKEVLSQVLNDYDQETNDFYRWQVDYSQSELSTLIKKRTGIDFGMILDLKPVERGDSGRLIKLQIIGDKKTMIIGKELEIRKALSESHLYSSAFVIEKKETNGELIFSLKGAGWGHGVGLCQIGAALMGAKGYDYKAILMHYFRGAELKQKY